MTVHFIQDSNDDAIFIRDLQGLHRPDQGVVVVVAKPGGRRDVWLYADILNRCGKDYLAAELQRAKSGALAYCMSWLVAEGITDLVLVHGEWSRHHDLTAAGLLAEATGIRLWVTTHGGIGDRSHEVLTAWAGAPLEPDGFWRMWRMLGQSRTIPHPEHSEEGGGPFPTVPATDFLTFRADAKRAMKQNYFEIVDRLYRSTFSAALEGLGRTEEEIARHLHGALAVSTDANARTVIIRAVQAAAFSEGLLVEVDLEGLLRAAGAAAVPTLTNDQWRKVASATQPRFSAIATLAVLGVTPVASHGLRGTDVADDGSTVLVGEELLAVPEVARRSLVAQNVARRLFGFGPNDPYLADGSKHQMRSIPKVLNAMTEQLGLPLRVRYARSDRTSPRWQYRWGVNVKALA